MLIRALAVVTSLVFLFSCGDTPTSGSGSRNPIGPSASLSPAVTTGGGGVVSPQAREDVLVNMLDACDPDTFNAVLGPGTCVRNGGVTFNQFIDMLTRLGFVGPWHFAPNNVNAREGQEFVVMNRGGEVHTFTEVEEFGGGIVPDLNRLAHVPNVAPECLALDPDDFVAPGATYREDIEEEGDEKYQCCIHPWMRLEAHVTSR